MTTIPIRTRRRGAYRFLACAVLIAAAHNVVAAPAAGPAECRISLVWEDSIASVGARGEMQLASGGRAVLGSIRWPDDPARATAAYGWLTQWRGRPLTLTARAETDRWGRRRVDALLIGDDTNAPADLAEGIVSAGFAYADADEGDVLCRPGLLGLEEAPRTTGTGIWARPPVAASDGAALRAETGRFVVVSGRILHVGERRARSYLDFAKRGEDGLTITVSKRTWRRLLERGLTAARLKGRTVRVRGIVEIWRGPTLDIASAEAIEVLDDASVPDVAAGKPADGAADNGERAPRR